MQAWEFILIPVYLLIIFLIASRIKNRRIEKEPYYKYYLIGLYAKIFGGLAFALIYIYYYDGGDTMAYYEVTLSMVNMLFQDPWVFFKTMLGPSTIDLLNEYDVRTGRMVQYLYMDSKAFMVCRLTAPLTLLGFKSYILTTILVSWLTYSGLWRLYVMFVRYYPMLHLNLAIAVLFVPSIVFWGSGIMKDSYTMAATGWFAYYIDHVFIRRNYHVKSLLYFATSATILIMLKPYIFMVLFPGSFYWIMSTRTRMIKNKLVMYLVLPAVYLIVIFGSVFLMDSLGDVLGKFSLDKALQTAATTAQDLKADYYGGSSFDIGDFEPTIEGVALKFVPATIAGLFRPYLWEARNVGVLLSGIENFIILLICIYVLFKSKVVYLFVFMINHPMVLFCISYSISFAFVIGLSTSNFGALVRFKIPLLPFFIAGLFIIMHLNKERKKKRNQRVSYDVGGKINYA